MLFTKTNDQAIVSLTAMLRAQSAAPVNLVSDDINARTLAEIENVPTASIQELLNVLQALGGPAPSLVDEARRVYLLCDPVYRHYITQPWQLQHCASEVRHALAPHSDIR